MIFPPPGLERTHLIGIGGAGMSALAHILLDRGAQVSGSDQHASANTYELATRGAHIHIGHSSQALTLLDRPPTAVIRSYRAIPETNPELQQARQDNIPLYTRSQALTMLMKGFHNILVTGTHGKTTTTSFLVAGLRACGMDLSFMIGAQPHDQLNAHGGVGQYFVIEADESDGSVAHYHPHLGLITNIEADHLDFFTSITDYQRIFDQFVTSIAPGGTLITCADDPGTSTLRHQCSRTDIHYGCYGSLPYDSCENLDAVLVDYHPDPQGGSLSHIVVDHHTYTMKLAIPGKHMALNGLGALLAAHHLGAPIPTVLQGLATFPGVQRRCELIGQAHNIRIFDDYAHHPTEIHHTLATLRHLVSPPGRLVVIFQPHLYSRTQQFAHQFASALTCADQVFILDVYGARETPHPTISGQTILEHLNTIIPHPPAQYLPDLSTSISQIIPTLGDHDVVVTMGAGNVTTLGPQLLAALTTS